MNRFQKSLREGEPLLLYGLTPPKQQNSDQKNREISSRRISRLEPSPIDALVIYDIQDEGSRTSRERPFPFLPTLNSQVYAADYLKELKLPKIIYICVGKYTEEELRTLFEQLQDIQIVLVGAPSRDERGKISLKRAYELFTEIPKEQNVLLGAVTIAERYRTTNDCV